MNRFYPTKVQRFTTVVVAGFICLSLASPVRADEYDNQINAIQQEIAAQQAEANTLRAQADTLSNKLGSINAQIAATNAKLRLTQSKLAKTVADLEAAKVKIQQQKDALAENIKLLYQQSSVSSLEILASSDNFSDFLDRQQYLHQYRDKITETLVKINQLKAELETQQKQLADLAQEQKVAQAALGSQRNESANLLAETEGLESNYQNMIAVNQGKVASLRSAQAEMWARIRQGSSGNSGSVGQFIYRNWSGNQGSCGGGYDAARGNDWCRQPLDAEVDSWDLYSRECVSYVAYTQVYRYGRNVPRFHGWGNADDWPAHLASHGYRVDGNPEVGAAVVAPRSMIGGVGHIMIVESVLGDGWIRISQYNFGVTGEYSTMDLKVVSGLSFIHF